MSCHLLAAAPRALIEDFLPLAAILRKQKHDIYDNDDDESSERHDDKHDDDEHDEGYKKYGKHDKSDYGHKEDAYPEYDPVRAEKKHSGRQRKYRWEICG